MFRIPREQMKVLDQKVREQFRHRLSAYLRRTLPEETAGYDDQALVAYAEASERHAAKFRIETEYGIAQWACMTLVLGSYLNDDPVVHEYVAAPGMDPENKLEALVDGINEALNDFRPMTDRSLIDRLMGLVAPLFDQPWRLRGDALTQRSWVAVPVESGCHVEPEDAPRIAAAIGRHTGVACYALATEPINEPRDYEVPATEDGLLDLSYECASLIFILVPAELTFALLFTSEDYKLYAGPRHFVESVLGTSTAAARSAFQDYADDPWWQGHMLDVHRYYDSIDREPV